ETPARNRRIGASINPGPPRSRQLPQSRERIMLGHGPQAEENVEQIQKHPPARTRALIPRDHAPISRQTPQPRQLPKPIRHEQGAKLNTRLLNRGEIAIEHIALAQILGVSPMRRSLAT